jgi:uncharacterized membrane protein YbhN (UPF0104 family)
MRYGSHDVTPAGPGRPLPTAASPRSHDAPAAVALLPDRRRLAWRLALVAGVLGALVLAVSSLPGLGAVRARLADASPGWLVVALALEIASCLACVAAFRGAFCRRLPWGLSYEITLAAQGTNVLLPSGGAGGLAVAAWALRRTGMPAERIGRRTVAFYVLTSGVNFATAALAGGLLALGVLAGGGSLAFTAGPAAGAALVIASVLALPRLIATRAGARPRAGRAGRVLASARGALVGGIRDATLLVRSGNPQIIGGAIGFMAFDVAALAATFAAIGQVPPVGVLLLAYVVGQLGNLIPLPGGVGGADGGLIAALVLYGTPLGGAAAAVLAYRAFQLGLPALLGGIAVLRLPGVVERAPDTGQLCSPRAIQRWRRTPASRDRGRATRRGRRRRSRVVAPPTPAMPPGGRRGSRRPAERPVRRAARSDGQARCGSAGHRLAPTGEHVGGDDAADRTEEMRLPGDAVLRQQALQEPDPPDHDDHDTNRDLHDALAEDAARDEVGRVAEDEPARAEVHGVGRRDDPHAKAADDADDDRHERDPGQAAERDRCAHHGKRDRVRDQVSEADMQERCRGDLKQTGRGVRVDAVGVQRLPRKDEIDRLQHPHQRDHADDELKPGHAVLAETLCHAPTVPGAGVGLRRTPAQPPRAASPRGPPAPPTAHSVCHAMADLATSDPRAAAWERRFHTPIIVAAFAVLPLIALSLTHPHGALAVVETAGHLVVWLTFAVEVAVMLTVVHDRRAWIAGHRLELLVVVVSSPIVPLALAAAPALRLLIVAKTFKTLKLAKAIKLAKLGKSVRVVRRKLALEGTASLALGAVALLLAGATVVYMLTGSAAWEREARTEACVVAGILATYGVNHLHRREPPA